MTTDNILDLDDFLLEKAKKTILYNLKDIHHCKWVNHMCVIRGVSDYKLADRAFLYLLGKNMIRTQKTAVRIDNHRSCDLTLYQYNAQL